VCDSPAVDSALNIWTRRIGLLLLFALVLALLLPASAGIIGPLFGIAAWTGAAFGYICVFAGIPFLLWIVGKAGYNAVLKPYVRARRIRVIRNHRLLREAAERQPSAEE
jgi:hypothetical protein